MIEVLIRAQDHDGNDPWEATAKLPVMPVVGWQLEVWIDAAKKIPESAFDMEQPEGGGLCERDLVANAYFTQQPIWLEVKDIILSTYDPDRIEIWVSSDGMSSEQMRRAIYAIHRNEQP